MTNNCKFIIICCLLLLLNSCSKAPDENVPEKYSEPSNKSQRISNKKYDIPAKKLILTSSDLNGKYTVATSFYSDRASLKFLKKPVNAVDVIQQIFVLKENTGDSHKITVLILKYENVKNAENEIALNFNILKNLANKDNIDSFQINVFGDESMGIKFQSRPNPLFIYSRYGNIVVKINGGQDTYMEKLTAVLKKIELKLGIKNNTKK
ncbi:hypothetical protein J7L67_07340 [bacterium]|nr:hypothetical protein [bacterium]